MKLSRKCSEVFEQRADNLLHSSVNNTNYKIAPYMTEEAWVIRVVIASVQTPHHSSI